MADQKLTELDAFTPVLTDVIYGADDPGGTPVSGKITLSALNTLFGANIQVGATSQVTGLDTALSGKADSTHNQAASTITSGTLAHEQGGLEADVSAYSGLVKISGGTTSEAIAGTDYAAVSHSHVQSEVTGLTTSDSPQFASINLGHATDTTLARSAAGQMTIEGVQVVTASNTATLTNKSIDASQLTGTVSVNRFNSGTGASSSTFLRGDGTWVATSGDVTKVGTPVANRMAYWTGDGTLGHEAAFTYDPTTDTLTVSTIVIGGVTLDGTNQLVDPDADSLMIWDDISGEAAWINMGTGVSAFLQSGDLASSALPTNQKTSAVTFVINGNGSAITTGLKGFIQVPMACTITAGRMLADQSGSAVVDVWKDTYANHPPVDADSITASAPLTISSAVKSEDTTLTGWTTSVSAGDILAFNVDSASTVTVLTVTLVVTVT